MLEKADANDPASIQQSRALQDHVAAQAKDDSGPWSSKLHVIGDPSVTLEGLDRAFALAKKAGHKVVVVDHIDQVGNDRDEFTGRVKSGMDAIREVNDGVLALSRLHKIAAVCTSQTNIGAHGDGLRALARYKPLGLRDVMYSSFKIKNATQIIGLYRPLLPGLSAEDFRLADERTIDPKDALAPGRMGVNMMKLRKHGEREGDKVELGYSRGQLRDLLPSELDSDREKRNRGPLLSHTSTPPRRKAE
jgi:hypothetical protein